MFGGNILTDVAIPTQHYKLLRAAVVICASWLHKDRQADGLLYIILLAEPAELKK